MPKFTLLKHITKKGQNKGKLKLDKEKMKEFQESFTGKKKKKEKK